MYRGACSDKSTIEDIADLLKFSGILFVIDRGFYSAKNLKLLSANDNTDIIPVPSNTDVFRKAMRDVRYTDSFYYRSGKKHARVEYTSQRISDTEYVYVFRDIDENEKSHYNSQRCIELGQSGYTQEKLEKTSKCSAYTFFRATAQKQQKKYSLLTKNAGALKPSINI